MPPSVWTGWWRSFMRQPTEASRGVVKAAEYDKSTLILVSSLRGAERRSNPESPELSWIASLRSQ